jgi:hypothetical protein
VKPTDIPVRLCSIRQDAFSPRHTATPKLPAPAQPCTRLYSWRSPISAKVRPTRVYVSGKTVVV